MTSGRTVVIIFETVLINKTTGMRRMGDYIARDRMEMMSRNAHHHKHIGTKTKVPF